MSHFFYSPPTIYEMALGLAPGVGSITAGNLLSYCGSAEAIFKSHKNKLLKIPMIGEKIIMSLFNKELLTRAEKELEHIEKQNIQAFFYTSPFYPKRLKEIADAPILIYYQGTANLNHSKIISIVGTRKSTNYGKEFIEQFMPTLTKYNPVIVSGLAYGIDIIAHKEALKYNLPTLGVMASGIDIIYPSSHKNIAMKMVEHGGILTESPLGTKPDAPRFPARNRIIAGLSDAVIVVEAMESGGAIITAELANDYDRDVFALAGNFNQAASKGCNKLIKQHKASLIESVEDIEFYLNWEVTQNTKKISIDLLKDLGEEEKKIIEWLNQNNKESHIDEIGLNLNMNTSLLSMYLLNLEMQGLLNVLPGKKYKLKNGI